MTDDAAEHAGLRESHRAGLPSSAARKGCIWPRSMGNGAPRLRARLGVGAGVGAARTLSLWRGEPLADVPSEALARREAGRLAELQLWLTEARIDADLRLGRHGELVTELRRLAAEHPLRERVRWLVLRVGSAR